MPDKDIKDVLSELHKVLADLKKEEKPQEKKETEPPSSSTPVIESKPINTLSNSSSVPEQDNSKSIDKEVEPVSAVIPPAPVFNVKNNTQPTKDTSVPSSMPLVTSQSSSPTPPTPSEPISKELSSPTISSQQPVFEQNLSPVEQIPENTPPESILKFACFYPVNQNDVKEIFLKNLVEVIRKTTKKPFYLQRVLELAFDPFTTNWEMVAQKCKSEQVETIFLIHPEGFNVLDLKNKFAGLGIGFQSIFITQLSRKITYVDLVIELMLTRK